MKSKISYNKWHNIDTNNKNDKIPESAPSELRYTTTSKNNHKNISKNDIDKKVNNDNINISMANNINSNSGNENNDKNNSNNNKGNCIDSNEGNSNSNNNNNSRSNKNNINSSNINSKTRKIAFIIGDSMVKKIDEYLPTSSLNQKYIVKVRPFLSAETIDMLDYIKPTQRDFNPDVYLLHVGTNDLTSNKSPEQISLDISNLANSLKLDNNTVVVSSIVPRNDEN